MLPAPAQGAIMVVCREDDHEMVERCHVCNDAPTALCTKIERDFLRTLLGGCSTPISALAIIENDHVIFTGNILSPDGVDKAQTEKKVKISEAAGIGRSAALELLANGANHITEKIRHAAQ